MSCEHQEVQSILKSLCDKLRQCTYNLSSQEIGNALYGLQGMNSSCAEVQETLDLFSSKIKR